MAETKKRRVVREEKPVPEVVEAPKKEVEEKADAKFLSSGDLLKCETLSRDVENSKLLMFVEEQALRNLILEYKLLENKIQKQKELLGQKANEHDLVKKRYNQYMSSMWTQYGIDTADKSLGYNPETGEIVKS